MMCPNCIDSKLLVTRRQDVDIDYCPKCSGLWLERGDLDRMLKKDETAITYKRKKISDVLYRHEFYRKKRTIHS